LLKYSCPQSGQGYSEEYFIVKINNQQDFALLVVYFFDKNWYILSGALCAPLRIHSFSSWIQMSAKRSFGFSIKIESSISPVRNNGSYT
jgi:hypothetical protein